MDRTLIFKGEEREASERLYSKLQGLMLLFPPSETLRKLMSDGMFVKSNPPAFFHVMQYLFWLLDPVEFKKRFYWPISDKREESYFRSSTVEYVNYLNEKHNLKWTTIKTYLVVTPGGMKFITFALDFVGFVVHVITKQRERKLGITFANGVEMDYCKVSDLNLRRMRKQNEFLKLYASEYNTEIDSQIKLLRTKTDALKDKLHELAQQTAIDRAHLTHADFNALFEADNCRFFEAGLAKRSATIAAHNDPVGDVRTAVEQFQSKEATTKINYDIVAKSLHSIWKVEQARNNVSEEACPTETFNKKVIEMQSLLNGFLRIQSSILSNIARADDRPILRHLMGEHLESLHDDAQQMKTKMTEFLTIINNGHVEHKLREQQETPRTSGGGIQKHINPDFQAKFLVTPPVNINLESGRSQVHPRISLMNNPMEEDLKALNQDDQLIPRSPLAPIKIQRTSQWHANRSLTSKIKKSARNESGFDPIKMLRSFNKGPSRKRGNNSALNITCQDQDLSLYHFDQSFNASTSSMIQGDSNLHTPGHAKHTKHFGDTSNILAPSSPVTPFNCLHDRTCIARPEPDNACDGAGDKSTRALENESRLEIKKQSALKKVKEAALHVHNISTSPMGRLQSMIDLNEFKHLPKVQITDSSFDAPGPSDALVQAVIDLENLKTDDGSNDYQLPSISPSVVAVTQTAATPQGKNSELGQEKENDPNEVNMAQIRLDFDHLDLNEEGPDIGDGDDDLLANVSDSVLKDVVF